MSFDLNLQTNSCPIGFTLLNVPGGPKCYQCSDPTVIPVYNPPMYAPSPSKMSIDATGSVAGESGTIIVGLENNVSNTMISETVIPGDQGKITCSLKPYLTYDVDSGSGRVSINKTLFQCDGGAEKLMQDLPRGVISPLDPGYLPDGNGTAVWTKTLDNGEIVNQEPRCNVIIPF
jgi:hypothetical protein